jgi:hypothetical protein
VLLSVAAALLLTMPSPQLLCRFVLTETSSDNGLA